MDAKVTNAKKLNKDKKNLNKVKKNYNGGGKRGGLRGLWGCIGGYGGLQTVVVNRGWNK